MFYSPLHHLLFHSEWVHSFMSGLLNDLVSQVKATHHGKSVELCLKIADLYCPHFTSRNLGEFTDQLLDLKMTIFSQKTYEYN